MQLASTRAVVTGGVSGLGFAVAKHLVSHGGKVALFDVNEDKGAAAVAELGEANARFYKTDVSNEEQVAANVATAKEFLGGLNAAFGLGDGFFHAGNGLFGLGKARLERLDGLAQLFLSRRKLFFEPGADEHVVVCRGLELGAEPLKLALALGQRLTVA